MDIAIESSSIERASEMNGCGPGLKTEQSSRRPECGEANTCKQRQWDRSSDNAAAPLTTSPHSFRRQYSYLTSLWHLVRRPTNGHLTYRSL